MAQCEPQPRKSLPSFPRELRLAIWEHFQIPAAPMTHVISYKLPNVFHLTSFDMLDAKNVPTMISLLRVSRETRYTILKRREVFRFDQRRGHMSSVYGASFPGHVRKLSYPFFFVDWEKDAFYFQTLRLLDDMPSLIRDARFTSQVQNIAFDFEDMSLQWEWAFRYYFRSWDIPWQATHRWPAFVSRMRALRSFKFVIPNYPFLRAAGLPHNSPDTAMNHTNAMLAMEADEHGFKSIDDAVAAIFTTEMTAFRSACHNFEAEASRKLKDDCGGPLLNVELVVDHLGYEDNIFGGYNRLPSLVPHPTSRPYWDAEMWLGTQSR